MIPVFERLKIDRTATVIGLPKHMDINISNYWLYTETFFVLIVKRRNIVYNPIIYFNGIGVE
jgi:hypothetical protein